MIQLQLLSLTGWNRLLKTLDVDCCASKTSYLKLIIANVAETIKLSKRHSR